MTRKHFKAIAELLRARRLRAQNDHEFGGPDYGVQCTIDEIAGDLASYFKSQNPRFDRERFLKAVGLEKS